MKRKLTVYRMQEKPCIRIVADYLGDFGFETGDKVNLTLSENKIVIEKDDESNYENQIKGAIENHL